MGKPIAIIGLSLKFPQEATSPQAFWEMLVKGRSAMTEIPKDRFNVEAYYDPDPEKAGTINVRGAHFVKEDIAVFDAPFFSLTPAEASCMDPQQRGLLECAYRALENAGIPMEQTAGSNTSVHVGCWTREYESLFQRDHELKAGYLATGTGNAMTANRLSWFYDFRGPSTAIDTACSSSLNALHLACQTLRNGEATMGLVAGCNLFYNADAFAPLTSLNFLGPDSISYSFDHRANGYARGEGFGVVVVKRLADALRDGNTIRAVVRATGVNQDGRTAGITQPSSKAQEALIRDTYARAGLDLKTTRFFEAHGTGTPIGDPLEASAIGAVFKHERSADEPLVVGAVKSNIGHLEGVSGIAGLIKSVLVLEHGIIPPNIWFEKVNPKILPEWNLHFPVQPMLWPAQGLRRASVNSFGYGGTNAHAILDDAHHYLALHNLSGKHNTVLQPAMAPSKSATVSGDKDSSGAVTRSMPALGRVFVFSSYDQDGIKRLTKTYQEYLKSNMPEDAKEDAFLRDLSYTLASKRSRFPWKAFTTADTVAELAANLADTASLAKPVRSAVVPTLGFVFTGQGAQWHAMGLELSVHPVYCEAIETASEYFKRLGCTWSIGHELSKPANASNINKPAYSQPICAAVQIALVDLLRSWGVCAKAVVGHSSGEIAAAYCTGAISRESAWKIAYLRGTLSAALAMFGRNQGAMMAVGLSESEVRQYLDHGSRTAYATIGCVNSPKSVTLSGAKEAMIELEKTFRRENVSCQILRVDNAYHSKFMEEVALDYWKQIGTLQPGRPISPQKAAVMYSSVTGNIIEPSQLCEAEYWVRNMVSPVRFADALSRMMSRPSKVTNKLGVRKLQHDQNLPINYLLEVGPHGALRRAVKETLDTLPQSSPSVYDTLLTRNVSAIEAGHKAMGRLFCSGHPLNLNAVNCDSRGVASMMVDLPEYPFNHSQRYWFESRISKNIRFREHARNDLLGVQVQDWNSSDARWRTYMRLSGNEWLRDHKITGNQLYPAAAMFTMAIEASRQLADSTKRISGFRLKDSVFEKALIMPSTPEGIEIQFSMRPSTVSNFTTSSKWFEFRLCSYESGTWSDHCHGKISVEYESDLTTEGKQEKLKQEESLIAQAKVLGQGCNITLDSASLYEICETCGLTFGPSFQTLTPTHRKNHVIHPSTLDGILQTIFPAFAKGGQEPIKTLIPSFINDFWISGEICNVNSTELLASTKAKTRGFREAECTIIVSDPSETRLLATVSGYHLTSVANVEAARQREWRRLCFNIDWKPDVDLLDANQAQDFCTTTPSIPNPEERNRDLEFMVFHFISKALENIAVDNPTPPKAHLAKYVQWMKHQIQRYHHGSIPYALPEWPSMAKDDAYVDGIMKSIEGSAEGRLALRLGPNLSAIIRGDADPLELLFKDDLWRDLYRFGVGADICYESIQRYVDAMAHKNPNLKILEIGAGTGAITIPILETLSRHGEQEAGASRFSQYMYTDISPSFFEKAQDMFRDHLDRMEFKVLDAERDPGEQGFDMGEYDLVVASYVMHATKDLNVTLSNTRRLLKPGGKLLLLEICNPDILRAGFAFGLLPGWWLSVESNRSWSPLMYENDWDDVLSRNGFTGNDIALRDWPDELNHWTSVLVSTATGCDMGKSPIVKTLIVAESDSALQKAVATQLRDDILAHANINNASDLISVLRPDEVGDYATQESVCVFLPELEHPFLANIKTAGFACLKQLTNSRGLLWLTRSGPKACHDPAFEMVVGFARCIRSENVSFRFTTLALESFSEPSKVVTSTMKAMQATLLQPRDIVVEDEFIEKDGVLFIDRVVEANYINNDIARRTFLQQAEPQPWDIQRPVKLTIASPGLLDTLQFVDDADLARDLDPGHVEIEVKATSMNFLDVMIALAQIPEDFLGAECAGVVRRVGGSVTRFKPGDHVWAGAINSFRTYVQTNEALVQLMPKDFSFEEAATLPIVYGTCYYAMFDVGRLQKGEKILIHSAAGGLVGAEIYATIGSPEKRQFLIDEFGLTDDHIFSSRDSASFSLGVMRATDGKGVDVVLNSLAGENLRATWECMAPFGRFLEIGKRDIIGFGSLPMNPFAKNVSFAAVDLLYIFRSNLPLARRLLDDVRSLAEAGSIRPPKPLQVFSYTEIEDVFRLMQSGKHLGKVVIKPNHGDIVSIVPDSRPTWSFDHNATYVISGGLGGLGRSMARWMVRRGAKHLILLSRSGVLTAPAAGLVSELRAMGCNVATPQCDVTDEKQLAIVLSECRKTMPPVKGCIQGAMVLKDSIFENMSLEDYLAATRPKVQGSWNLHKLLPKHMDFFILLSSGSGVFGGPSQSNYGSGNAYQDALARYRSTVGEKAVSLDLGMILSVGFAAERAEVMDMLRSRGYMPIRETEFLAMLEYHCDPLLSVPSTLQAQVATGIETPASLRAKGIDEPVWMPKPLFRNMYQMDNAGNDTADGAERWVDFQALLGGAHSVGDAGEIVTEALTRKLAKALSMPVDDIDAAKPMHVYGVDSLVAVEMRNWLAKALKADVAVFELMGNTSIASLGIFVAVKSQYLSASLVEDA
ncbi:reducing type I polyketide synthase [Decorospora gaudefroyi]|uniref:Reducing type I polyketide synthase n=1 Tax=Decorospora gaudefroyi TaxID=184978 RepID=A0A6A5K340_9PLEO|nr:reducing type I polyketide synthase [Decorospora gaudefroyi]